MLRIEKSIGFSPQKISGLKERRSRKTVKPRRKTASEARIVRRRSRQNCLIPRPRSARQKRLASARRAKLVHAARLPWGRIRSRTRTTDRNVATARPRILANPAPRSSRYGKSDQATGRVTRPRAAIATSQISAAAKEPTSSSCSGRAEEGEAAACGGGVAGTSWTDFAAPLSAGACACGAATATAAAAVIRTRPSAPASVRRKFFRRLLNWFSVSSRKKPAAGQLSAKDAR